MANIRVGQRNRARELEVLAFIRDCAPVAMGLRISVARVHAIADRRKTLREWAP